MFLPHPLCMYFTKNFEVCEAGSDLYIAARGTLVAEITVDEVTKMIQGLPASPSFPNIMYYTINLTLLNKV